MWGKIIHNDNLNIAFLIFKHKVLKLSTTYALNTKKKVFLVTLNKKNNLKKNIHFRNMTIIVILQNKKSNNKILRGKNHLFKTRKAFIFCTSLPQTHLMCWILKAFLMLILQMCTLGGKQW